jgi:cephalosporin hydroxylase
MMNFMEELLDRPLRDILPLMQQRIMEKTTYFGVTALKNPLDFWIYQELIHRLRPDVIIEIGNFCGGGTLALAHLCDLLGHGKVIGVDVSHAKVAPVVHAHSRITLIEGDACSIFEKIASRIRPDEHVMVIEDSSHSYENTLAVLRTYSRLIHPGGYFVVEDGICHHGLEIGPQPGPFEAIESFTAEHDGFVIDRTLESFPITWNPKGFLKRIKN